MPRRRCCCEGCQGCDGSECAFESEVGQALTIEWNAIEPNEDGYGPGYCQADTFDSYWFQFLLPGSYSVPIIPCQPTPGVDFTDDIDATTASITLSQYEQLILASRSFTYPQVDPPDLEVDWTYIYQDLGDCISIERTEVFPSVRLATCAQSALGLPLCPTSLESEDSTYAWEHSWIWAENVTVPTGTAVNEVLHIPSTPPTSINTMTFTDAFAIIDVTAKICMGCYEHVSGCKFNGTTKSLKKAGYRRIELTANIDYYGVVSFNNDLADGVVATGIVRFGTVQLTSVPTYIDVGGGECTCINGEEEIDIEDFSGHAWYTGGCTPNQVIQIPLRMHQYTNYIGGLNCRNLAAWNCPKGASGYGPIVAVAHIGNPP